MKQAIKILPVEEERRAIYLRNRYRSAPVSNKIDLPLFRPSTPVLQAYLYSKQYIKRPVILV
jgi:hypothetical protein